MHIFSDSAYGGEVCVGSDSKYLAWAYRVGCPADAGQEFIDNVNRFRDRMRHLDDRWQNALVLNNVGLVEKYLSGRFTIALDFNCSIPEQSKIDGSAWHDGAGTAERTIALIYNENIIDCLRDDDGEEEPVLVSVVEFVKGPEKRVLSLIRAYRVANDFPNTGGGFLYGGVRASFKGPFSLVRGGCAEGRYKVVPGFVYGKHKPSILPTQNFRYGVIEGAFHIVNEVPEKKGHLSWHRVCGNDLKRMSGSIRVVLNDKFAEVSIEESVPHHIKDLNLMIGPYML